MATDRELDIESYSDFGVLLRLARDLAQAEKIGDPERIAEARKKHDDYKEECLNSDWMIP